MRHLGILGAVALAACATVACRGAPPPAAGESELYYLVFLRPDPGRKPIELAERQRIQAAHMANIQAMARAGILAAAGPMDDTPTAISGIFVLRAPSLGEASRIAAQDPTVAERRNTADVHPWLGPAGIGSGYFHWKKDNPGAKDVMAVHVLCLMKRGRAWTGEARSLEDHALYVESMRRAGLLAAAGDIDGDPSLCSACVFKTSLLDEAKRAAEMDPAVQSGRLAPELHRWWTADRVLPW